MSSKKDKTKIKDAVKKCKEDLKKTKMNDNEKITELTILLKNIQADFENYKKRVEKEKGDQQTFLKKEIITKLLPTLDMFELALKHTENKNEFVKGVEMIYSQFMATLQNEGLQTIKETEHFNPELHEAVITEEGEKDGIILEELQKGYKINDKVIRYTRVKVSKKSAK